MEDTLQHVFVHADTGVADFQGQCSILIIGCKYDGSCFREFNGIGQQVVNDLLYTVRIAFNGCIGSREVVGEYNPFVVYRQREPGGDTFQQCIQFEGDVITLFLRLVQTVHVQQVVKKMQDVFAEDTDIREVTVPFPFVAGIHCQFRASVNGI